jgi:hypothetical protein
MLVVDMFPEVGETVRESGLRREIRDPEVLRAQGLRVENPNMPTSGL